MTSWSLLTASTISAFDKEPPPSLSIKRKHCRAALRNSSLNAATSLSAAAFARAHGMKLRGHALLWHQSTPPWAKDVLRHAPGDWRPVREHFTEVVPRFRDIVEEWDVVNEPIDTEGGVNGLRNTCFHQAFGPNYIHNALVEARMHAPKGKLAINEFSLTMTIR